MKPRCLFSVIIAVRNGAATLPRALDSLFSQTHAEWECLIQDHNIFQNAFPDPGCMQYTAAPGPFPYCAPKEHVLCLSDFFH